MQEASDAHSKTADSDTVSTYQVSSVKLVTDKKLEAFNDRCYIWRSATLIISEINFLTQIFHIRSS